MGGLRFSEISGGLPCPSALAGRIQLFSQLPDWFCVTSAHRDVCPTDLRTTGLVPSEGRASGPKLPPLNSLTSLCLSCSKEVLFCVCQDAINLRKDKISGTGGLSEECTGVTVLSLGLHLEISLKSKRGKHGVRTSDD